MPSIQETFGQHLRSLRNLRGYSQERLGELSGKHFSYIGGLERGEKNPTLEVLEDLAHALEVPLPALLSFARHPLEEELNAPAADIMEALRRGFRAKVDAKGKLAEFYLNRVLHDLQARGDISSFEWADSDGDPDFKVVVGRRSLQVECKNLRDPAKDKNLAGEGWGKAELQKTRGGKDKEGKQTRGYTVDHFDILAACCFNLTHQWEFRFNLMENLERRPDDPGILKVFQVVWLDGSHGWVDDLTRLL